MSEDAALKALEGKTIERRYRLLRLIREGNFGGVFHARHMLFDKPVRDVAVKISRKTGLDENSAGDVFADAIQLARVHEGVGTQARSYIVPIYDLGILEEHGRRGFIVMGLIRGKGSTPEQLVAPRSVEAEIHNYAKGMGPDPALAFFRRICLAMAEVHAQRVIHRDLKPDNILLTDTGDIRIVDFGLAAGLNDLGVAPGSVGTYDYMAPETATRGESDARANVYTLGILLYEMLTAHSPFEHLRAPGGLTEKEAHEWTLKQKERSRSRKPSDLNRSVPEELANLVLACLSFAPAPRPADAGDLLRRLDRLEDPVSQLLEEIRKTLDVGWRKWIGGKPDWDGALKAIEEARQKCPPHDDARRFTILRLLALCQINRDCQSGAFAALDELKAGVENERFVASRKEQAQFYDEVAKALEKSRMRVYAFEYQTKAEDARRKAAGREDLAGMGFLDFLIPSARRRRKLDEAAQAATPQSLLAALPLTLQTDPRNAKDLACLFRFFERLAPHACDAAAEAERGMAHLAAGGGLGAAEQQALGGIYAAMVQGALARHAPDAAVSLGLAGCRCAALAGPHREAILAALVEGGCGVPEVLAAVQAELAAGPADRLAAALRKASRCDPYADAARARAAEPFARLAIALRPTAAWGHEHAASALLATDRAAEAEALLDQGLAAQPAQPELAFLLGLVLFRQGRYTDSLAALARAAASAEYPAQRLHEAAEAAHAFCDPPEGLAAVDPKALAGWARTFAETYEADTILGPVLPFVRGRIFAATGSLERSVGCLADAAAQRPDPLHVYYAVHVLQLLGRWPNARALLANVPPDRPELQCLRLRQLRRDGGPLAEPEAMARLGGAAPDALLRAKHAVLSGRPAPAVPAPAGEARAFAEERTHIALAAALATRDLAGAEALLRAPLVATFPSAEKAFYQGALLWLRGRNSQAADLLQAALKETPEAPGALKCLAACQLAQGNAQGAAATLKRVVESDPTDVRSQVRLILACCELGRYDGLPRVEALKKQGPLTGENAYRVGRALVQETFRRLAGAGSPAGAPAASQEAARRTAGAAAGLFDAAAGHADARAYRWLCSVLTTASADWPSRAADLIAACPAQEAEAPVEVRWVAALLRTWSPEFDVRAAGAEELVGLAASLAPEGSREPVAQALWRAARLARTPAECAGLCRTVEWFSRGGGAGPLRPLVVALAWRSLDAGASQEAVEQALADAQLTAEERGLGRALWHLARGETEAAAKERQPHAGRKLPHDAPWLGLLDGLLALHRGDLTRVIGARRMTERPDTARPWAILEAAARAHQDDPRALDGLAELLKSAAAGPEPGDPGLPMSGLLACLAAPNADKQRAAAALAQVRPEDLLADPERPAAFVCAAACAGAANRAFGVAEQNPTVAQRAGEALLDLYCRAAAQAIEAGDYVTAHGALGKATARP